jgi:hypothetical protein
MIGLAFRHENRLPLPGLAVGSRGVFEEGAVETQGLPRRQRGDQPRLDAPENRRPGEEEKLGKYGHRQIMAAVPNFEIRISKFEFGQLAFFFSGGKTETKKFF